MTSWIDRLRGKRPARIPEALWCKTIAAYPFLKALTVNEKNELKTKVEAFLAEKEFSTAGSLELTDDICVSIAAQGCLPSSTSGWAPIASGSASLSILMNSSYRGASRMNPA